MARRASYLKKERVDSVANLTVEAGNFAPFGHSRQDSVKALAFTDFYRKMDYDAVALSSQEVAFGLKMWEDVAAQGLPVLVANVFTPADKTSFFGRLFGGKPKPKPLFQQVAIREDKGEKLGVIGFISPMAWKASPDSASGFIYQSPYEMGKLVNKTAKDCDHLTVVGEFTERDADSLARAFPVVDLIVSSAIKTDKPKTVGRTVIVGSVPRGSNVNYIELRPAQADSANYGNTAFTLDGSLPEDTTVAKLITSAKEHMSSAAQPAKK